jgi:hypothetical protein
MLCPHFRDREEILKWRLNNHFDNIGGSIGMSTSDLSLPGVDC